MNFPSSDKVEQFRRLLEETIVWCSSQNWTANPAEGLRSPQLRPPEIMDSKQALFEAKHTQQNLVDLFAIERVETNRQWLQHVEQLAMKRATLLRTQDSSSFKPVRLQPSGRLLAFDPQGTLRDGAANLATQGFFDDDNVPAWDTWIAYVIERTVNSASWHPFDSYLLSWVPELLVKVVEAGISVNPEECIRWAADLDTAYIRQLRQAGLIG